MLSTLIKVSTIGLLFAVIASFGLPATAKDELVYMVVDPILPALSATSHVHRTLEGALGSLRSMDSGASTGATIILFPGDHLVSSPIRLDVLGLSIVSRDGPEQTRVVFTDLRPDEEGICVFAEGVLINGVTLRSADSWEGPLLCLHTSECRISDMVIDARPPRWLRLKPNTIMGLSNLARIKMEGNPPDGALVTWSLGTVEARSEGSVAVTLYVVRAELEMRVGIAPETWLTSVFSSARELVESMQVEHSTWRIQLSVFIEYYGLVYRAELVSDTENGWQPVFIHPLAAGSTP